MRLGVFITSLAYATHQKPFLLCNDRFVVDTVFQRMNQTQDVSALHCRVNWEWAINRLRMCNIYKCLQRLPKRKLVTF